MISFKESVIIGIVIGSMALLIIGASITINYFSWKSYRRITTTKINYWDYLLVQPNVTHIYISFDKDGNQL